MDINGNIARSARFQNLFTVWSCYDCYSLYFKVTRYNAKPRKPLGNAHCNTFGRNLEALFENLASTKKLCCSGFQAFLEVNRR